MSFTKMDKEKALWKLIGCYSTSWAQDVFFNSKVSLQMWWLKAHHLLFIFMTLIFTFRRVLSQGQFKKNVSKCLQDTDSLKIIISQTSALQSCRPLACRPQTMENHGLPDVCAADLGLWNCGEFLQKEVR